MSIGNRVYVIGIFLIACSLLWQMTSLSTPQPKYKIIKKDNHIEIRQYPPLIMAQVNMQGERYSALNAGFKILADYIFGNNQVSQKIAMTAPVMQQVIPIVTSVSSQKQDLTWHVSFVMPPGATLAALPKPLNQNIRLSSIPTKKYAVIGFSGSNTQTNLDLQEKKLLDYLTQFKLQQLNSPIYAFYNPPWILPLLRRNEILIEIK